MQLQFPIIYNPFFPPENLFQDTEFEIIQRYKDNFRLNYNKSNREYHYINLSVPKPPEKYYWFNIFEETLKDPAKIVLLIIFFPAALFVFILTSLSNILFWFFHIHAKSNYKKDMKIYYSKLPSIEENNNNYYIYQKELDNATRDYLNHQRKYIKKEIDNKNNLLYYNFIKNKIDNILTPIENEKITQKGISENYFRLFLHKHFASEDFNILTDNILVHYIPDFILFHSMGFYLDIEIDEPYVGSTKEIIHFYNPEKDIYSDDYRNTFFLENNWIVIRFTEKQVLLYPDSCCYEIALLLKNTFKIKIPSTLKGVKKVPIENLWSNKQADEMALFNYRNTYIPKDIISNFG